MVNHLPAVCNDVHCRQQIKTNCYLKSALSRITTERTIRKDLVLEFELNDNSPIVPGRSSSCVSKEVHSYLIKIGKATLLAQLQGVDPEMNDNNTCREEATHLYRCHPGIPLHV